MTARALAAALALAPALAAPAEPAPARTVTLEEALRDLDAQSPTLAQARGRVEEAAGLARQALAPALPTLGAAGSYTRNSDEAVAPLGRIAALLGGPAGPDLVIQPREVLAASATLRLPLVSPVAWAEAAAAHSSERAARAGVDAARSQLRTAVVQAAWAARAAEEAVAATERAVASAQDQADLAQRALDAGTGVPLAVLQARTEVVKRRSDLARAGADLERARLAAGVLLGRAEPVRVPLADPPPPPAADADALAGEALGRRPELRATAAQLEAAGRQLTAARLRLLPQLSASCSVFAQDVALPTGQKEGWRLGLELSWSLYDGGARYGRARAAEGALAVARAGEDAQRLRIAQEVQDAARAVAVAAERLRLAEEQVGLAAEAAATARRGFAAGIVGSLDVLDANDRLFQAEVALAEARARLGAAAAELDRAAGRGA